MARTIKPDNKVTVFDPKSRKFTEAPTSDIAEMERRRAAALEEAKEAAKAKKKTTKKAK